MATLLLLRPVTGARYDDKQVNVVLLHGDTEPTKMDMERLVVKYHIDDSDAQQALNILRQVA